jgi:hypothetical protein
VVVDPSECILATRLGSTKKNLIVVSLKWDSSISSFGEENILLLLFWYYYYFSFFGFSFFFVHFQFCDVAEVAIIHP